MPSSTEYKKYIFSASVAAVASLGTVLALTHQESRRVLAQSLGMDSSQELALLIIAFLSWIIFFNSLIILGVSLFYIRRMSKITRGDDS